MKLVPAGAVGGLATAIREALHPSYKEAARAYRKASEAPGAPAYVGQLAASLEKKSSDCWSMLEILHGLRTGASGRVAGGLVEREKEVQLECMLQALERAQQERTLERGEPTQRLEELVQRAGLPWPLQDPFGGHFLIRADGTPASSTGRGRIRTNRKEGPL